MNGQDKKDLNVILEQMKQADRDREQMHTDIKFIKENLFNPETGLWAETKLNTQHRQQTTKWRTIVGGGVIALMIDMIWDMFTK